MPRRPLRRALVGLILALVGIAPQARADTTPTPYVPWSSVLPGWNDRFDPGSANDCAAGRSSCLAVTLNEQLHIFTPNGRACSHVAIFPLAYVRMTQTYGWTRTQAGYYHDVPYMNHLDAVFARYYTTAYDTWSSGDRGAVPQAWLTAFDAAQNETVSAAGDLFLGMNAHINRDLPFVLYASGLVESDGTSGKADYDAVERWLSDDTSPLLAEAAQRFDPTIASADNPIVNFATFQAVSAWRETAWRNAEALASAPDAAARAVVAANIENTANLIAAGMVQSFAVGPTTSSNATRDAYCAVHNGDTAPTAYPMGTPSPYGNSIR